MNHNHILVSNANFWSDRSVTNVYECDVHVYHILNYECDFLLLELGLHFVCFEY